MDRTLDLLGEAVLVLGHSDFAPALLSAFDVGFGIDHLTVFCFGADGQPSGGLAAARGAERQAAAGLLANAYLEGGFAQDPMRQRCRHASKTEVVSLSPGNDPWLDRNFRTRFYDEPELCHEMALLGAFAEGRAYMSLYRARGRQAFNRLDAARLRHVSQLSLCMIEKHMGMVAGHAPDPLPTEGHGEAPDHPPSTHQHLRDVLLQEGHGLTQREAEVCAYIALGFSTLAISLTHQISINTVATHRKRAYAKLGIGSQNELFTRYFETVKRLERRAALH
jgi:DNA-binding CsgD family transcriptional regulator